MSESFVEISPRISDPHMRDTPIAGGREAPLSLDMAPPRAPPGVGRYLMIGALVTGIIVLIIILTYQLYVHFSTTTAAEAAIANAQQRCNGPQQPRGVGGGDGPPPKGSMLPPKLRNLDDAAFKQFISKSAPAAPATRGPPATASEMEKKDLEFISNIVRAAAPPPGAAEQQSSNIIRIPTREEIVAEELESHRAEAAEAAMPPLEDDEPMIREMGDDEAADGAARPCEFEPRSGKNVGRKCGRVSGLTPGRCSRHART